MNEKPNAAPQPESLTGERPDGGSAGSTPAEATAAAPLPRDLDVRDCNCADPENCMQPVPGYRCRKGEARAARSAVAATPRTDALLEAHGGKEMIRESAYWIALDHARQLERELAAKERDLENERRSRLHDLSVASSASATSTELEEAIQRAATWLHKGAPQDECASTIRDVAKLATRLSGGTAPAAPVTTVPTVMGGLVLSQDLYQLLLDVQNEISAPGHASMANGLIQRLDKARAELYALQNSAQSAIEEKKS